MKNSKSYKEERAEVIEKMEGLVASAKVVTYLTMSKATLTL